MTGYYSEDNLRASLDAGADAVLAKPFERDALLAALQLDVGWPLPVRSSAAEGP
jgi:CheY-like chemotaxis protein